jgi:hypothetical protein
MSDTIKVIGKMIEGKPMVAIDAQGIRPDQHVNIFENLLPFLGALENAGFDISTLQAEVKKKQS